MCVFDEFSVAFVFVGLDAVSLVSSCPGRGVDRNRSHKLLATHGLMEKTLLRRL